MGILAINDAFCNKRVYDKNSASASDISACREFQFQTGNCLRTDQSIYHLSRISAVDAMLYFDTYIAYYPCERNMVLGSGIYHKLALLAKYTGIYRRLALN